MKRLRRRDDQGFTLVELLIVVAILPLVAGAIAAGFIATLQNRNTTTQRLSDSHDAQISSSYFVRDVKSAQYVSTSNTPMCGVSSYLLGLSWSRTNSSGTVLTDAAVYSAKPSTGTLIRTFCEGASSDVSVVAHNTFPLTPAAGLSNCPNSGSDIGAGATSCETSGGTTYAAVTINCTDGSINCANSAPIASTPQTKNAVGVDKILLSAKEHTSGYTYNVTASPQGWNALGAGQPGGGTPNGPPLQLINNPSVSANGNCSMSVNGIAAINTTTNGSLPGPGNFNADEIYSQTNNPQTGGSTPEVVGPPLADPYAALTPPAAGDANVTVVNSTFSPNGQLDGIYILKNGLSMSGQNTISTGPNGVLLYVTGGNVNLTGGSGIVLSKPFAKYAPISIWIAASDTGGLVSLGGNSGATTIGGTIYAPSGGVSFGGTSGISAGGVVAKTLDCHGTSDLGVGPVDTTTTLTATPSSPSADGQPLNLTATVKQAPNGTVDSGKVLFQVKDKNGTLTADCAAAAVVDNTGAATCTTGPLSQSLSNYTIKAIYQGNVSFDASTSNTITQQVLIGTTTKLTTASQDLTTGQAATLTATVTPDSGSPASGNVTFGGVTCTGANNVKPLVSGVATCTTGSLKASSSPYAATATYAESASPNTWLGSSDSLQVAVAKAPTTLGLVSSKPSSRPSNQVVFTATVGPVPTGGSVNWSITYGASGTQACTSTTNLNASGVATCTVAGGTLTTARSPYTVTATYTGNVDYLTSTNTVQQLVATSGSQTAFSSVTVNKKRWRDHVIVTGNDGGVPTGSVAFYLCTNATTGCTSTTPGVITLTAGTVTAGTGAAQSGQTAVLVTGTKYCFAAVYGGDGDYVTSSDTSADQCFTA